jgi:hypothetical protein
MADRIKVEVISFNRQPDPHHVVEVEQAGVKRRVTVRVGDSAWTGLGWFASDPEPGVRMIALNHVERRAAQGALRDEEFIGDDEAADIYNGRDRAAVPVLNPRG